MRLPPTSTECSNTTPTAPAAATTAAAAAAEATQSNLERALRDRQVSTKEVDCELMARQLI